MAAWEELVQELGDQVAEVVLSQIRREMSLVNKENFEYFFTEEEAAKKLKVSPQTLKRERDDGAIDYTRYRGKIIYMPHHLIAYGLRNEVKNGKQEITLQELIGFGIVDRIINFPNRQAA